VAGRYRIERELGGGGQKQMYLAADLRLSNRLCALAELTPGARTQQAVAEGKAMFRREAETLSGLSNFHIVQVYDFFDEADRCYLVEEYVRGQTLQQRIASHGRLSVEDTVEISMQILEALEYLHSLTPSLVHRDLKPDNVMLAPATGGGEIVKLIDFGIARHFQVQRGTVHGTPGYAAPEQYRGLSEPRTDLYALGGILHYALSGRDPQEHEPFSFPPLESMRPDLPKALCALVDQALINDAESRPASAAEFKSRLSAAVSGNSHPPTPAPHPAPPRPAPWMAPTVPLPGPVPQPHPPPPRPEAVDASRIEWNPAQLDFQAVERGAGVPRATVTIRNTGRGTLEAHVDTDRPDLLRVSPSRIRENQAELRVALDSSSVMWGHRYYANIRIVLDHSGQTVAIPVVIEAADNQTVLDRVRLLSTAAWVGVGMLALGGEILLAHAGMTVSRALHGVTFALVREVANLISVWVPLAILIMLVARRPRRRGTTLIVGLIAIFGLHAVFASVLIDYLLFPALVVGLAEGNSLLLRRTCIRLLARQGLGLGARFRALLLLVAPPAAATLAALAWLITAASPAPSLTTNRWVPPPMPYGRTTFAPRPPRALRPPVRYRAAVRPRRAPRPPEFVEAQLRERLAASGFGAIGVSVDPNGSAYLSGSAADFEQEKEIENIARTVAGVRAVYPSLQVPKGWMGLTVTSAEGGAMVQYLMPNGPAAYAGIAINDVIVSIDGDTVGSYSDFHRVIESKTVGQTVSVTLQRGGQTMNVAVTLKKRPFRGG